MFVRQIALLLAALLAAGCSGRSREERAKAAVEADPAPALVQPKAPPAGKIPPDVLLKAGASADLPALLSDARTYMQGWESARRAVAKLFEEGGIERLLQGDKAAAVFLLKTVAYPQKSAFPRILELDDEVHRSGDAGTMRRLLAACKEKAAESRGFLSGLPWNVCMARARVFLGEYDDALKIAASYISELERLRGAAAGIGHETLRWTMAAAGIETLQADNGRQEWRLKLAFLLDPADPALSGYLRFYGCLLRGSGNGGSEAGHFDRCAEINKTAGCGAFAAARDALVSGIARSGGRVSAETASEVAAKAGTAAPADVLLSILTGRFSDFRRKGLDPAELAVLALASVEFSELPACPPERELDWY